MSNRLKNEESPYLKQHANNPVNWFAWGKEAFEIALKENKPIFVSIGYSSCHWCHVMEKESFENKEIADILNKDFISIKVDKEERPDIDKHFQEIFIKMNNKPGGWPLSIFLTPNKIPIYSATYIPPYPKYGLMGFKELLNTIAKSYKQNSKMLEEKGLEVLEALKPKTKIEATKLTPSLVDIASKQLKQVFDKRYGGFGSAPKFPHSYTLNLAINLYKLTQDKELLDIVTKTLNSMFKGGLYDIVDSGISRYSTDEQWLIPHFEKMTYDNALIITTLTKAYEITNSAIYKKLASNIANFMLDKMSKNNLFFSASDADSNNIEGEYFTFEYNRVKELFLEKNLDLKLLDRLNITKKGNFNGKSIVRVNDIKELEDIEIKKAIKALKSLREQKEYPFIDNKIITSWNSMMIAALFNLSKIEPKFLDIALNSLKALEAKMTDNLLVYHSALIDTKPKIEGFLEDYAWLIDANIEAFNHTLDELFLIRATNLTNEAIKKFYKNGLWQIGNSEFKNFEEDTDSSYPSSVAIMVKNLLTLRSLVEPIYEKFAFKTLEVNSYNIMRQPISRPTITNEAIRYIKDDIIIKSKTTNLKELIKLNFKYPYTLLKPTLEDEFEVCSNKACFAKYKDKDSLIKELIF